MEIVIDIYELYHSSRPRQNLFGGQVKGLRFSESNSKVLVVAEKMKDALFGVLRGLGLGSKSHS